MSTRKKCAITLMIFFIIDIGPLPLTCLIGLSVVAMRPMWFKNVVDRLYAAKYGDQSAISGITGNPYPTGTHQEGRSNVLFPERPVRTRKKKR